MVAGVNLATWPYAFCLILADSNFLLIDLALQGFTLTIFWLTGFDSKVRKNRLDKGYFFTAHDKKYQEIEHMFGAPKRRVGGSNPLRDVLQLWDDLDINLSHSIF